MVFTELSACASVWALLLLEYIYFSFYLAYHQGHFPCAQYMFSTSWWGHLSFISIWTHVRKKSVILCFALRWDCLSRGRRIGRWTDNSLAQTNRHSSSQIVSWNMMFVSIFKENILIFFSVPKKHRLIYCLEGNKSLEPDSLGSFLLHHFFVFNIIVYPISKLNRIFFFKIGSNSSYEISSKKTFV